MHTHVNLRAGYPSHSRSREDGPHSFRLVAVAIAALQHMTVAATDALKDSTCGCEIERTGGPHSDADHICASLAIGGGHHYLHQIAGLEAKDSTLLLGL